MKTQQCPSCIGTGVVATRLGRYVCHPCGGSGVLTVPLDLEERIVAALRRVGEDVRAAPGWEQRVIDAIEGKK